MLATVFTIAQTVYLILGIIKLTPEGVVSNTISAAAPGMSGTDITAEDNQSVNPTEPTF
jgi:hypothetical protein